MEVLREWLAGKGVEVSWDSLIATLRDCKLSLMAEQIQMALSHTPSSSHFGLSQTSNLGTSNMFGELSQPVYPHPTSYHKDPTAYYLHGPHHHNYHHHHHSNSHRSHENNKSKSQSRFHSPKYPNQLSQTTLPNLSLKTGGHQYLSHRTLPYEGRMGTGGGRGVPMRRTRSDDLGRSKYHLHDNSAQRSWSRSQLSDTESWVESTQRLHHNSEIHPPPHPPSHPSHSSHSTCGSDPRESPPEPPQTHWGTPMKVSPPSLALSQKQPVQMDLQKSPRKAHNPAAKKVPFSSLQEKCSSTTHYVHHQNKNIEVTSDAREFTEVENPEEFCGDCPIPDHMTVITTLSDCTSEGRKFTDEDNDFSLEIPEGAIPEGERLTIDVGVALFGPFQFPEGLRPVSPVFWICVRDNPNFQFSKRVTVTIPHFLHLENDEEIHSLGLVFLKANHKKKSDRLHIFQPADGEMKFEPSQKFGILKTTHFCSLCLVCTDKPDVFKRTHFCITSVLPKRATVGKKQNAFFFITFYNLRTCLAKVDEIIKEKKLEDYEKTPSKFNFKFKGFTKNPALEMIVTQPKEGTIGIKGIKKVWL